MAEHDKLLIDILNSFKDGAYIVGRQNEIEYTNPVIEGEFGKAEGRKCHEYFHGLADPCPWCGGKDAFAGKSVTWEWCSQNTGRHFELMAIPVQNAGGGISKLEIRRDVTEKKLLQQKLARAEELASTLRQREKNISFEMHELREVIESNTDTFYAVNLEGKLVKWNGALEKITGLSPRELKLKPAIEFFHEEDRPLVSQKIREVFEKGHSSVEARFIGKDGDFIPHLCNGFVTRDAEGSVTGFAGTGRDISERKRMEEAVRKSEARYRELFENAGDYIYTHDMDGIFTSVNRSLCERTGYRPEELVGFHIGTLVSPENTVKARGMTEAKISGGRSYTKYELEIIGKSGEVIPIELNTRLILKDGRPAGVQGVARDIGERKRAEQRLKAAKEAAEAATLIKNQFVSLVSHDLKSPLATIVGMAKIAVKDNTSMGEMRSILDRIIMSGSQMNLLITNVLSLSRLQTGSIKLETAFFDMGLIGKKLVMDHSFAAGEKGIELVNSVPEHTRIYSDKVLLTEALQNLVSNAIKFCRRDDRITISTENRERPTVVVEDSGPGFKPDAINAQRAQGTTHTTKGSAGENGAGYGLAIVREIAEMLGGNLIIESPIGKGSRCRIELPLVHPYVLVVDDDAVFRAVVRKLLQNIGVETGEAENGQAALDGVRKRRPHLIISDIGMSGMNGLDLLKTIKNDPLTEAIPVIIASGTYGMEIRDAVFGLGAADFINKQFDVNDFIPRVRRFVG